MQGPRGTSRERTTIAANGEATCLCQASDRLDVAIRFGPPTRRRLGEFVRVFAEPGVRAEIVRSACLLDTGTVASVL